MLTRKTQYGWMVLGGILCLCGGVIALKLREGNPAVAQAEPPSPPAPSAEPPKPLPDAVAPPTPAPPADARLPSAPRRSPPASDPPVPSVPVTPPPSDPPSLPPPAPANPPPVLPPSPDIPPGPPPVAVDPPSVLPPTLPPVAPPEPKAHQTPEPMPPAPVSPPPSAVIQVSQVGEPPLAGMGPLQCYRVRGNGETMRDIARHTLGAGERWSEVYKLNPSLRPEDTLAAGTVVHLPPDACLPADEVEGLKPLPAMRPTTSPAKPKSVMALTGTYPCNLDDKRTFTLPRAVRDQFGDAELVLVSPGPDQCLWLTDPAHQERLAERLEHSPAREIDVRVFKRLYYAQTEKVSVGAEGRVTLSDRLAQFAGLSQEVVLVGIDDHFEVWDAARWKQYTQAKSAAAAGSE